MTLFGFTPNSTTKLTQQPSSKIRILIISLCGLFVTADLFAQEPKIRPLPLEEVRLFTEAMDRIRQSYVEEVDDKTLLENAIKGMLSGLDPHSSYLTGTAYDSLQETTKGEFGGLGIEVGQEDGYIKVISPIDNTPADRAGVEAGDLIIKIDGRPLREMRPDEAVQLMRGEPGTDILITIVRQGEPEPFDITLTREIIPVLSVRQRTLEPGYGYIRISQFKVNTGNELADALEKLKEENESLHGLILDLRNNPGGVLQASVQVVDSFIPSGKIVFTKGRFGKEELEYNATALNPAGEIPTVVLINNGSASASEIVAGALQDHNRAIIMGTRSFGKGSVQTILPLADDRAIKLTTSLYYTPNGRSIQAQGIEPDIIVSAAMVTRRNRSSNGYTEADLRGHLENGNDSDSEESDDENSDDDNDLEVEEARTPVVQAEQVLVSDFQMNEALNLLKGLHAINATTYRSPVRDSSPQTNVVTQTSNPQ